jgi:hypothetical protein
MGSSGYAIRGTRFDVAFGAGRLARYLDKWSAPDGWCDKELVHQMGYYAETAHYKLHFINEGDAFENLWVEVFSDSDVNDNPRSTGGHIVLLSGPHGSTHPVSWSSKLQAITATSSGDAEVVEWGRAAKAAVKVAALVERTRVSRCSIHGFVDNDAARLAAQRGSSAKLSHLHRTGNLSLKFLMQNNLIPARVDGTKNLADVFTKILSSLRLRTLCARLFGLQVVHDGNVEHCHFAAPQRHRALCGLASSVDFGLYRKLYREVCICELDDDGIGVAEPDEEINIVQDPADSVSTVSDGTLSI